MVKNYIWKTINLNTTEIFEDNEYGSGRSLAQLEMFDFLYYESFHTKIWDMGNRGELNRDLYGLSIHEMVNQYIVEMEELL